MRKQSHSEAVTTLSFLAHVASAYALVSDDTSMVQTPATTWWNLPKLYEDISALPEPRWVMWVNDINNGIWPDASDSALTDICMAIQSHPSGTLIINFKNLCDLREANSNAFHLERGVLRQFILSEHNRHRADNNLVRLLSDEHKLVLHNAIARDVQWYDGWIAHEKSSLTPTTTQAIATEELSI